MLACRSILLSLLLVGTAVKAFAPQPMQRGMTALRETQVEVTTVEVCGFKDCKRAGGGPRLQKLVNEILEEKDLQSRFSVEGCDCQGECGYGPNILVDGRIKNDVKGREAVLKALGIEE